MQLKCPQCHHPWSASVEAGQPLVQCPECFLAVPLAAARSAAAAGPSRPAASPAPPQPSAPVDPVARTRAFDLPRPPASRPSAPPPDGVTARQTASFDSGAAMEADTEGSAEATRAEMEPLVGRSFGGYELKRLLGVGGMGAVFLARQTSLARDVALKVLPDRFAQHPEALARFTREALSAAQLTHHHIVQVHDVGCEGGRHYICMEFVEGTSLGDMVRREGRLMPDDAAGYVLQAARGLKYAHDRGIIHRDIKPDNLLLNGQGVVKIADLGLAKMLGELEKGQNRETLAEELKRTRPDLTLAHRGLGTPAYMPPEQARDASSVDAKADQYSLGCTLYYLCAGRCPYDGTTAFEMISKHLTEPLTPLAAHVRSVPAGFSAVLESLLEKNPADRFPGMGDVIQGLEHFLGVDAERGPYAAREHHLSALDAARLEYYDAPLGGLRRLAVSGFYLATLAALLLALLGWEFAIAGGILAVLVLTPTWNFLIGGLLHGGFLFRKIRSLLFGMSGRAWLGGIAAAALGAAAVWFLGWTAWFLGAALLSGGIAAVYQVVLVRRLRNSRKDALDSMRGVLRQLRLRGLSEEALQEFVARFSREDWEEFFEDLFGYEALLHARARCAAAEAEPRRRRHAPWRDPIARRVQAAEAERRTAREKRHLAAVELRRLKAEGIPAHDAVRLARREAEQFVMQEMRPRIVLKMQATEEEKAAARTRHPASRYLPRPSRRWIRPAFNLLRGALGLAMIGAFLLGWAVVGGYRAPGILADFFSPAHYYSWGWGGQLPGLVAGAFLFFSAYSRRSLAGTLVLLGALGLVFCQPLVDLAGQPNFTPFVVFWLAAGAAALGFGSMILGKLGGGRF